MVISNKVQQFIEKYIPLIDANKFTYIYRLANKSLTAKEIGELTQTLIQSNINPLEQDQELDYIPDAYYLNNQDLDQFNILNRPLIYIGKNAFSECSNLISVAVDCEQIQSFAFSWCRQLKSITLTKRLKNLDISCFFACPNFDTIYYRGTKEDFMINVNIERANHIVGKRGGVTIRFNDGTSGKLDEFYKK